MALGIPVTMVVLTIVGMAGMAAMLTFMEGAETAIPRHIHADVKSDNLILLSGFADYEVIETKIQVMDSTDGTPLLKANVVISGPVATAINLTDADGFSILRFKKTDFDLKSKEGYLKLDVKANGFLEYSNEYAIKIVK